ncbi:hypothetical protein C8Q77DRAFT_1156771 [Trametes polyzona]|nr:hypothetical protein C8Q77DRAFT_1156771 [Trametes polyzona]
MPFDPDEEGMYSSGDELAEAMNAVQAAVRSPSPPVRTARTRRIWDSSRLDEGAASPRPPEGHARSESEEEEEGEGDGDADEDEDEEDRCMVALGFAAYQNTNSEEPMADTTDHEANAVPATFADPLESISQDEIDSSVLQLSTNVQDSREEYDAQRFSSVCLSDLKRWYESGNVQAAMASLHGKHALHIDSQFLMSMDDPMFVFGRPEVRLDCKIVIGLGLGLDPALPNMRAPGVAVDPLWRFTLRPDLRFFEYRADRKPIGFDPQGRMVYFGLTRSAEDVWLVAAPRECVGRTPLSDLSFSDGPTKMSARDVRVAMALLAWMLYQMDYGDMVLYPEYPAIDSDAAFGRGCDLL